MRCVGVLTVTLTLSLSVSGLAFATDPVVSSVTTSVRNIPGLTLVDVTFSFSDAESNPCHIAIFGHDAASLSYYPMIHFSQGDIYGRTWTPGTHTVTWVASADREAGSAAINSSTFKVYVQVSDTGRIAPGRFLVIDVSGGGAKSYPLAYTDYVDVQLDVYKTDKVVLRELPNGAFVGVFEITQRQYQLVTGSTPSSFAGNYKRPVEQISWNDLTGSGSYAAGFIATLRTQTGLSTLGLPSSMAWEDACRAGTTFDFNDYKQNTGHGASDETTLARLGWYSANSGLATHDAGGKQPNAWGLYDMHGNVWEWNTDATASNRIIRGGSFNDTVYYSRSYVVGDGIPGNRYNKVGFRLALRALGSLPTSFHQGESPAGSLVLAAKTDTDADGLDDAWETAKFGDLSHDGMVDTDFDRLTDLQEYQHATDPNAADTDRDGVSDGVEVLNGTDPVSNADSDEDGLPDDWEIAHFGDLSHDGTGDADSDGLSDLEEYQYVTNPKVWDSDGDDMPDGWEVENELNPAEPDAAFDPDLDDLTNIEEYIYGTDPNNPDSDGDTYSDGVEVFTGSDPNDNASIPPDVTDPVAICQDVRVYLGVDGTANIAPEQVDNGSTDDRGIASMALSQSTFTCANLGENPVSLTVTDTSGNTAICGATVMVVDDTEPTVQCQDIQVALNASGLASFAAEQIDAGSSDICGISSMSVAPNAFACADLGANTVTLTVTDTSGNTAACGATVTVVDIIAPMAVCLDVNVALGADGTAYITPEQMDNGIFDNCGVASKSVVPNTFTCANLGANLVTVTVIDTSGNTGTCDGTVTVTDPYRRCDGDMDNDGMEDAWETTHFGDLTHDGTADGDSDGLTDSEEFQLSTDPNDADSDDDTWLDGDEVSVGTNPLDGQDHPVEGEGEGEGEGEIQAEGEGEVPVEGEGEASVEGEGEGEGESPAEGEGESVTEGESMTVTVMLPGNVPLEMVWMPAGTFMMGSPEGEQDRGTDEGPQHQATFSQSFWMGKYELTQAQWTAVMGTTPWLGQNYALNDPNSPVVYVSWNDAQSFITELYNDTGLTFRLPSEAEWEYACRAGTTTRFYWGDDLSYTEIGNYAWFTGNAWNAGQQYAHEVGGKLPNDFGLYDMSGNVWEWCQDWYGSYAIGAVTDPTGPATGSGRVFRGGSFYDSSGCRSTDRNDAGPSDVVSGLGFRLASSEQTLVVEGEGEILPEGEGEIVTEGEGEDSVPPECTVSINGDASWTYSAEVTLDIASDDGAGSGVTQMRLSEDGSTWGAWETVATSKAWTLSAGDGDKPVYAQVRDAAGNVSASATDSIGLDTTAPECTVSINNGAAWTNSVGVTLGIASDDGAGSGVTEMRFGEDGSAWGAWEAVATSKAWTLSAGDGVKQVYAQVRDAAGNVSTPATDSIGLDTTHPTTACRDLSVALGQDGTVSITGEQVDYGSTDDQGIASMALSQSTFTCANLGANTVTLTATDTSGNVGTCESTVTVSDPNGRCEGEIPAEGEPAIEGEDCGGDCISFLMPDRVANLSGENGSGDGCVYLPITVNSADQIDAAGIEIHVDYDPDFIDAETVEVEPTAITGQMSWLGNVSVPGEIIIVAMGSASGELRGIGHIFDIHACVLSPIANGECTDFSFSYVELVDQDVNALPVDYTDLGQICISNQYQPGDVNGDGRVTISDALTALKMAVNMPGFPITPEAKMAGDMNGDRRLDSADAVMIQRAVAQWNINPEWSNVAGETDEHLLSVMLKSIDLVSIEVSQAQGTVGGKVLIPVTVSDGAGLSGFDFALQIPALYAQCLSVANVYEGDIVGNEQMEWHENNGSVRVSMGRPEAAGYEKAGGEAVLATIEYNVLAAPADGKPIPLLLIKPALKGQYGDDFAWYTNIMGVSGQVSALPAKAEEEGEAPTEGEGEGEGEGEKPPKGLLKCGPVKAEPGGVWADVLTLLFAGAVVVGARRRLTRS